MPINSIISSCLAHVAVLNGTRLRVRREPCVSQIRAGICVICVLLINYLRLFFAEFIPHNS